MNRQARIENVIQQVAVNPASPQPDQHLFESGILDSFGLPDLIAALENEFHILVPDTDLQPGNFSSIRKIEAYLEKRGA